MKRKLKVFSSLFLLGTITMTSSILLTSCSGSAAMHPYVLTYDNYESSVSSGKNLDLYKLPKSGKSMKNIIYGGKSLPQKGNFVLYIGDCLNWSLRNFVLNDANFITNENTTINDQGIGWLVTYLNDQFTTDVFEYDMPILIMPDIFKVHDETEWYLNASYNDKWSSDDEENITYPNDFKPEEGKYKRNDQSAKNFRALWDMINILRSGSFPGMNCLVFFKDGLPVDSYNFETALDGQVNTLPPSNTFNTDIRKKVYSTYKVDEDDKDDNSDDNNNSDNNQ